MNRAAATGLPRQRAIGFLTVPDEELRRRLIGERTSEALAARRRQGVRLGRPRCCPDEVLRRVIEERRSGARLADICERLNADGLPTPGGGRRWYPSHLSRLLRTQDALGWRETTVDRACV